MSALSIYLDSNSQQKRTLENQFDVYKKATGGAHLHSRCLPVGRNTNRNNSDNTLSKSPRLVAECEHRIDN